MNAQKLVFFCWLLVHLAAPEVVDDDVEVEVVYDVDPYGSTKAYSQTFGSESPEDTKDLSQFEQLKRAIWRSESDPSSLEDIEKIIVESAEIVNSADKNGITPLMYASTGNGKAASLLIQKGADVNTNAGYEETALMHAVHSASVDSTKILLESGADVHAADKNGTTAIAMAVKTDDAELVTMLVQSKANLEVQAKDGFRPMHIAAVDNRVEMLNTLLALGADIEGPDTNEFSPLSAAASYGSAEAVRALLSKGAKIESKSNTGQTPLMNAGNSTKVMKILLDAGADISAATDQSITALVVATVLGNVEGAKLLLERGAKANLMSFGTTPLSLAATNPDGRLVKVFLDHGISANDNSRSGRSTPLMNAASHHNPDGVRHLLDHGADINAIDNKQRSPLIHACRKGDLEIVKILVERRALINHQSNEGATALSHAALANSHDVVRYLLHRGADVTLLPTSGRTALIGGALGGNAKLVPILMNGGDDPNYVMQQGQTAVGVAVMNGNPEYLDALLRIDGILFDHIPSNAVTPFVEAATLNELGMTRALALKGANVNTQIYPSGKSSLYFVIEQNGIKYDYTEMIELLIEFGADRDLETAEGKTPKTLAAEKGLNVFDRYDSLQNKDEL